MNTINIITRPMYVTDKDYRKGMTVAVYEGTTDGSWIARNADNINNSKALRELLEKYPGRVNITHLPYDQIDQVLAGWKEDPNMKGFSSDPKDHNVTFETWEEIFDFQSKKDGANYTKLKNWLKKHFNAPVQKI